jgi:hypothetical protein
MRAGLIAAGLARLALAGEAGAGHIVVESDGVVHSGVGALLYAEADGSAFIMPKASVSNGESANVVCQRVFALRTDGGREECCVPSASSADSMYTSCVTLGAYDKVPTCTGANVCEGITTDIPQRFEITFSAGVQGAQSAIAPVNVIVDVRDTIPPTIALSGFDGAPEVERCAALPMHTAAATDVLDGDCVFGDEATLAKLRLSTHVSACELSATYRVLVWEASVVDPSQHCASNPNAGYAIASPSTTLENIGGGDLDRAVRASGAAVLCTAYIAQDTSGNVAMAHAGVVVRDTIAVSFCYVPLHFTRILLTV